MDTQADWSPDGHRFAFTRSDATGVNPDIWVIETNGRDARQLTYDAAIDERPAWRPRDDHHHDHDEDD
jgi:Tol biopolymer transport system component